MSVETRARLILEVNPMDIRQIDDNLAVSPQVSVEDVAEAAKLGFKTLVANRPDH